MLKPFILPALPISRFAPTPSGFLHIGNALNFILTWLLVRRRGGRLHLRIDDMDGIRVRPEVVEDIFYSLDWLGLDWDTGPSGPEDFHARFSLMQRMDFYARSLSPLLENGLAYVCDCSRKSIASAGFGAVYPGLCRNRGLSWKPGKTTVRLHVPPQTVLGVGSQHIRVDADFGDFVLWRKENLAAYHLASVLEDEAWAINLVVRGADLLSSTAAQLFLARVLGLEYFPQAVFVHHGLIPGEGGKKLSKSKGDHALCDMREKGLSCVDVYRLVADFLQLDSRRIASLGDLGHALGEAGF